MTGEDGFLTRAEARVAELGPDISERLRLTLEECFAHSVIAEADSDTVMASAYGDAVEALGKILDLRYARGDRATAEMGTD